MALGAGSYPEPPEEKCGCERCESEFNSGELYDIFDYFLCEDCALEYIQDNPESILYKFFK